MCIFAIEAMRMDIDTLIIAMCGMGNSIFTIITEELSIVGNALRVKTDHIYRSILHDANL